MPPAIATISDAIAVRYPPYQSGADRASFTARHDAQMIAAIATAIHLVIIRIAPATVIIISSAVATGPKRFTIIGASSRGCPTKRAPQPHSRAPSVISLPQHGQSINWLL